MSDRELELCVETLQACEAASSGGADRLELCSALGEGGVTPSRGLIRAVVAMSRIPVHVLVRPRGGSFEYSDAEFQVMCGDVEDALGWGATGVVVGMLLSDGRVDVARMRGLMKLTGGGPVTFHRAFDRSRDLSEALKTIIDLGCNRVLTSGGEPDVMRGYRRLAELAEEADGRVRIAAGGGVTLANASELMKIDGLDLHASLRGDAEPGPESNDPLWKADPSGYTISLETVRALSAIAHAKAHGDILRP